MAEIYSRCAECMGPLPDGPTSEDPFCSDECEQIAEEAFQYGYPGADETVIIGMIQRYGPAAILPHLAGGQS